MASLGPAPVSQSTCVKGKSAMRYCRAHAQCYGGKVYGCHSPAYTNTHGGASAKWQNLKLIGHVDGRVHAGFIAATVNALPRG